MKKLFEQYGGVVITAIAVIALMFILSTNGVLKLFVGVDDTDKENKTYENMQNEQVVSKIYTTEEPKVTKNVNSIKSETKYNLKALLTVTDSLGQILDYEITDVVNIKKEDESLLTDTNTYDNFTFPKPGVYRISLEASDTNGIHIKKEVSMYVNRW